MKHERHGSRTEIQAEAWEDGRRAGIFSAARLARWWLKHAMKGGINGTPPERTYGEGYEAACWAIARELAMRGKR